MGVVINALRGMHVCVPRNMTQAVGMYNTLLKGNDPGLVVECLNGYRLKEKLPSNLLEYTVPLGVPEVIREGDDLTIVSYGSTLRIVQEAADRLSHLGIHCEVVDVQTLLPFDIHHGILASLKKQTASCSWMRMFPVARQPICSIMSWKHREVTATLTFLPGHLRLRLTARVMAAMAIISQNQMWKTWFVW